MQFGHLDVFAVLQRELDGVLKGERNGSRIRWSRLRFLTLREADVETKQKRY